MALVATLSLAAVGCGGQEDDGVSDEPGGEETAADPTTDEAGDETDDEGGEAAGWEPSQPIEIIVPYGAGGGTDRVFRQLTEVINSEGLSSVNWIVSNREGGAGTAGMQYVIDQAGTEHLMLATTPGHITVPQLEGLPFGIDDLQPVANLVLDPQVLVTHDDSGYDSLTDVVDQLRAEPGSVTVGGGPVAQDDWMTNKLMEIEGDLETNYVAFAGGGELETAILGGQVDVAWMNPSEYAGNTVDDGGNLVPLAVALEEAPDAMEGVPTFQDEGVDFVYELFFRSLTAPADVDTEVLAYYSDVVRQATETEAWLDFIESAQTQPHFLGHEEFSDSLSEWSATLTDLLQYAEEG